MTKYKLNDYHHDCYCDEIAKVIESENGYTERKNGTIWVKQPDVKGMGIISEIENTIRDVVHARIRHLAHPTNLNLDLFDHISYFVTVDGEPFAMYCPYHTGGWIETIPEIFERGVFLKRYSDINIWPYYMIIARRRRVGDEVPDVKDFL